MCNATSSNAEAISHDNNNNYEHVYFANADRKQTEDIKTTEIHASKTKYEIEEKRAKCITETICTTYKKCNTQ